MKNDTQKHIPECKYCNDEGFIYSCMNCLKPAIYDYEYGVVICDDCLRLGEKQNTYSEKCSYCNIADIKIEFPKVGDKIHHPTVAQIDKIINWQYQIKIPLYNSYDIIMPIKIANKVLMCFSSVENNRKCIELVRIPEIEVISRHFSTVSMTTNLKGLKNYIQEDRNRDLFNNNEEYIRLVRFEGYSWDANDFNFHDIDKKENVKKSYFANGLTLNIQLLLKNNFDNKFRHSIKSLYDSFYFDPFENTVYLIESISKFEIF